MFDFFQEYDRQKKEEGKDDSPYVSSASSFSIQNHEERVFVLSAGGSLFFDETPIFDKIRAFCEVLSKLHSLGHKFVLVVGGGKPARSYVETARDFGANNYTQDELGIMVTRLNASLFISGLQKAYPSVLTEPKKALRVINRGMIPVFGGLLPSFTTDAVAALIAEAVNGEFVNLTDVDGVYSADPKKSKTAKFFPELSYDELLSMFKGSKSKPGQNMVLDLPCVNILRRSNIRTAVLNGNDLENFENFVQGQTFTGTIIQDLEEEAPQEE